MCKHNRKKLHKVVKMKLSKTQHCCCCFFSWTPKCWDIVYFKGLKAPTMHSSLHKLITSITNKFYLVYEMEINLAQPTTHRR